MSAKLRYSFLLSCSLWLQELQAFHLLFNCPVKFLSQYFHFLFLPASGEQSAPFSEHLTKFNMANITGRTRRKTPMACWIGKL